MLLKDLTTLTASLASGTLFHVEKSGKAYNIDYTKLAKAIVEEYNGSTLGGSAQTVQAAIGALNSSLIVPNNRITIPNNSDINTYTTPGVYAVVSDASASTMTNMPRNASGKLIVMVRGNNLVYIQQKYITTSSAYVEYVRNYNNGTWTTWEQLPTRAEVDANTAAIATLNSRIAVDVTAGENVAIDTNKSYAVGKMLFLLVKGHASADVTNAELFTISGVTLKPTDYTFFCGVGAEWSLTGIGYCYVNVNKVVGRITSGQYFHICVTIPIN